MSNKTEQLKLVGLIRKAILPLVEIIKNEATAEANKTINDRFDRFEEGLIKLADKPHKINVEQPEVNVTVEQPEEMKQLLKKLNAPIVEKKSESPTTPKYEPHDQDGSDSRMKYNGFVAEDGSWYIQRITKGQQRYAKGKGSYSKSWEKRGELDYKNLDGSD